MTLNMRGVAEERISKIEIVILDKKSDKAKRKKDDKSVNKKNIEEAKLRGRKGKGKMKGINKREREGTEK